MLAARVTLTSQLGMSSTSSLAELQSAISLIADPTRRALLQTVLAKLIETEPQPYGMWRP
jgi:hypothetical protein